MKIGIIGCDIVGLAFGLLCEEQGHDVLISDENEDFIYNLNQKVCLTNEPFIQSLLLSSIHLSATTDPIEVIKRSDIIFTFAEIKSSIEGSYDTTKIFDTTKHFFTSTSLDIPLYDKKFVVCSTTNPGDVEQIQKRLSMFNIEVAYNPPIITHGELVNSFRNSNTIIIGSEYDKIKEDLSIIYRQINIDSVYLYLMSIKSAEVAKIGIDGFLATKITYANLISNLMGKMDLNEEVDLVLDTIGGISRIGKKYLKKTYGFTEPSTIKSSRALIKYLKDLNIDSTLPSSIKSDNDYQIEFLKIKFIESNPDKSIPFIFSDLGNFKEMVFNESSEVKLCIDLLTEGYTIYTYYDGKIPSELLKLSESYENRLKFFKPGTSPEGYKIKL
jgi:UDPglucose 6-dehydrogenase